ncbi:flavin monoamine oxidase family protein [Saccharothrix violaceirubra]|uniref:Monoamine oxidase n=1 Tax=Saccharothrix violaceirubra TaxID=413306 RepID=A0A7W7T4B0_9PSEU|nr:NAD(P)/FAD-dependent oxidoreductase [Saccharothrix violaceirubra]MBB4966277.1 monoamine oxidase [Saccharothrix violaceirubra]
MTVIGAGIAGLVGAYELERRGHDVEVLEGSGRIGGRVYTHRFSSDSGAPSVELGAMRIPVEHRHAMHYITELGLADKVRVFRSLFSDDGAYCATGAGHLRVRDAARALVDDFRRAVPERRYADDSVLFGAWLMAAGNAIAPADFRTDLRRDLWLDLLDAVERVDLSPFLRHDRVDLHAFFALHPEIRMTGNGRLDRFLHDVLSETSPDLVRLAGGMDQLAHRLAGRLRGPVVCGQEVVGLTVREHDVLVAIRDGDQFRTRRCDYVLCTVPFSGLRRMWLSGFSRSKLEVIRDMTYWGATKVAFHCREPFWEQDDIGGGATFAGGLVRQTYYPPVEGDPAGGAALLASYTIGADADVVDRMPDSVRHAVVLQELGRIHPELLRPGMVLDAVSLAWGRYWWSGGAASVRWGLDTVAGETERVRAAEPENRLFFAGEHCSSTTAWIEGAIESAVDAAREIDAFTARARLVGAR